MYYRADDNIYDSNELPSKSANLLPEYTDPPWMLEQGWTLDNSCMDEKSKATIEKMLLEEQYYITGKSSRGKQQLAMSVGVGLSRKKGEQKKIVWTKEEKDMFHKGMEIYGRSWTKIAELIPTRTSTQIKNFAHQLFRTMNKDNKDMPICKTEIVTTTTTAAPSSADICEPDPLTVTVETVTTGSPTCIIKTAKKSVVPKRGRIPAKEKFALQNNSILKRNSVKNKKNKPSSAHNSATKKISKASKTKETARSFGKLDSLPSEETSNQNNTHHLSDVVLDKNLTVTPGLIENLDGFCAVANIISDNNDDPSKNEESDDDVHIDIENDDDSDSNPILIGRSTSPNSVYEKLLTEANLNEDSDTEMDDKSSIKFEENGRSVKNFLDWKTCESQKGEHDRLTKNVNSSEETICNTINESKEGTSGVMDETADVETDKANKDSISEVSLDKSEEKYTIKKEDISRHVDSQKVLVNALLREDGEVVHFPVPTAELTFQPKIITDQEKEVLKEFFENRPSKTPERYLKIRNYIVESWKKCKPNYLNKTSVRSGLKNCGDVNSIGRVHAYLECIGAINFGCEQAAYRNPRSVYSLLGKEKVSRDQSLEVNSAKLEAMRPRKRKVKDAFGFWIDEKDLEGMTFEHGTLVENQPKESKPKQTKTSYDPFKLIPCLSFSEDHPAPFLVEIHCSALIVMDIHSHMCKTEVIGMLGGKFCVEQGKLTITMATPCNSISTGMQCEMDPVSQTQASEEIRGSGMDVVGWYHSHPTFAPNPSVRDIETQLKFQNWFSKGGSNFVGVIISPYSPRNPGLCSEVNCLTVSKEVIPELQCNIPYKFSYTTRSCDISEVNHIMLAAQDLATSYSNYPNRVDLVSMYSTPRGITCIEKMLESLKTYCPDQDSNQLIEGVRKAFTPVRSAEHIDASNSSCETSDSVSTDS